MPYASGRIYHDADSRLMELPGFLRDHAPAELRDRLPRLGISAIGDDPGELIDWAAGARSSAPSTS